MMLTGAQVKRASDAILAAYTLDELRAALWKTMGVDPDDVSPRVERPTVVFNLINWAERTGRTAELLAALKVTIDG